SSVQIKRATLRIALRLSAVKGVGKLGLSDASPALFASLKSDHSSEERSEALKSLVALDEPRIGDAIEQALSDNERSVRVTALDLLTETDMAKETMVSLLSDVINTRTIEEKQAALTTLGTMRSPAAVKVLEELVTGLES